MNAQRLSHCASRRIVSSSLTSRAQQRADANRIIAMRNVRDADPDYQNEIRALFDFAE